MKVWALGISSTLVLFLPIPSTGYSVYRPGYTKLPCLETRWLDDLQDTRVYRFVHSHLEAYPFRLFNRDYFEAHKLPAGPISFRYDPSQQVTGQELSNELEVLLEEVKTGCRKFSNFVVLQDKDFNWKYRYGLAVFKCTKYPFVVKLFIETPKGLTNPFKKGLEPAFFFFMSGGVNRHMLGFTRIPNLEMINKRLEADAYWQSRIVTPRKWYWQPRDMSWIELRGYNMGVEPFIQTVIPSTYAIVADLMEMHNTLAMHRKTDRILGMRVCEFFELNVDPHITNFLYEKGTRRIVIVDTEHFPSIVGYRRAYHFNSYVTWYGHMMAKCLKDIFWRTKPMREKARDYSVCYWPFECPAGLIAANQLEESHPAYLLV